MNNKKMSSGQITGVGCDVSNCKYNTIDCKCSASQIKVQNDKATTKSETFCSTFCPRGCCDYGACAPTYYFRKSATVAFISGLSTTSSNRFSRLSRPSSGLGIAVFVTSESFSISSVPGASLSCPSA